MSSEVVEDPVVNEESDVAEDVVNDSHSNKRKRGKVPKKLLKAERERLKREQLNDHFEKLAGVLDLNQENNGKASVLNETIKLIKDMISHIQNLRKENATLLSESQYMTAERNELKEEKTALELQISKMQNEVEEKLGLSKPDLNVSPAPDCCRAETPSHFMEGDLPQMATTDSCLQKQAILGPLYVIPLNPELQAFQRADTASNPPTTVSKPHPRYPTPADSWPLQLLSKQAEATIQQTSS